MHNGFHQIDDLPSQVELENFSGEVDHFIIRVGGLGWNIMGYGPIEEQQGLEEREVVANPTTFLDDMVDDGRGDGMNGGDLRAVKGESASVGDGAWVSGDG